MTTNKRTRNMHNKIKHFILKILSAVFLILSIIEMLGGVEILGDKFKETGNILCIVMLIPVILIGITIFIISSKLLNYKTRYDKEQIEAELGFKGNDDFNKLSYEQLIEKYSIDYDMAELGFKGNDDFNKLSYEQLIEKYIIDYDIQALKDYDRQFMTDGGAPALYDLEQHRIELYNRLCELFEIDHVKSKECLSYSDDKIGIDLSTLPSDDYLEIYGRHLCNYLHRHIDKFR